MKNEDGMHQDMHQQDGMAAAGKFRRDESGQQDDTWQQQEMSLPDQIQQWKNKDGKLPVISALTKYTKKRDDFKSSLFFYSYLYKKLLISSKN
jgi:hypothetical protein